MDRLSSMATFVRAADLGSFAAAAEATGLSPTMVGKQVQYLEARLGVRLIHRTTRRQSLTDFGRAYYERCRGILAAIEAADALAADHLHAPQGTLRVTMPALLGRVCVAPLLLGLAREHPALRLEMSMNDRIVDLVGDAFDLAVRTGQPAERPGFRSMHLGSHRMLVCASPAHLRVAGVPRTIADLRDHVALAYARPGWDPAWRFRDDAGGTVDVLPSGRALFDDLAAVTDAAVAGDGLAWIPSWLARPHLDAGTLVEVLGAVPAFEFDNHALWPESRHLPLRLRLALGVLADGLPAML